ncbi:MAG: amino acid adenylation domain-containing protein, partial [Beijerinckiaceae bacterium]
MNKHAADWPLQMLTGGLRSDLMREETLADVLRATAQRAPDKMALHLIGGAEQLTYAELNRRSDAIAAALAARGVKRGEFVGLWFTRSLDLHVAMIGIAKSGAAFIPFDADAPADRIAVSLADCGARFLLTHAALATESAKVPVTVLDFQSLLAEGATATPEGPTPDSPAYAIYTSGSTGKPKGIVITHRNITHYLRSGNAAIGMMEDDIVFQGASVAFDLSMEEIWIPYLIGATLKVAPNAVLKDTDTLPLTMARENITVLDVVPTLLTMLDRDIPSVRLIITGGEALTGTLVERWSRPGRRIVNTYGPTETTVVATFAECVPGEPITIGVPIPNYTAYVLDEQQQPVAQGVTGELVVGGPGVAQGYINLPAMTAAKFIANPFGGGAGDPILYRTGDAVSIDGQGRILFHGRIDDQVKIRGYRIELGEIESLIAAEPGVKSAAVAVHKDAGGGDVLVAHVVAGSGAFDAMAAKRALAGKLPAYMVPHIWQTHEALPQLVSGKVDRKKLIAMPLDLAGSAEAQEAARTETESALLKAAQAIFPGQSLPFDADFFTELGGHSLIAARFISEVRKNPALAGVTLQDVYAQRTLRKLAATLDERFGGNGGSEKEDLRFSPPPFARRFWCGVAQTLALPFILAISTAQWLGVFLTYMIFLQGTDYTFGWMAFVLSLAYGAIKFGSLFLVIGLKWIVMGRTKPGVYPLWGSYFFRWWFMQRLYALGHPSYLANSPLMRFYLRALGAKVGTEAMISHCEFGAPDLVEIGAWTAIGHKAVIANAEVEGDTLIIGRVKIEDHVFIGNQAIVPEGCVIGHDARIEDLTALAAHTQVAPYEIWDGSPARKTGTVDPATLAATPTIATGKKAGLFAVYAFLVLAISSIGLIPIFPAFYVFDRVESFFIDRIEWL